MKQRKGPNLAQTAFACLFLKEEQEGEGLFTWSA
jgi:hypothetical protein